MMRGIWPFAISVVWVVFMLGVLLFTIFAR
jgi:hypothetical protein